MKTSHWLECVHLQKHHKKLRSDKTCQPGWTRPMANRELKTKVSCWTSFTALIMDPRNLLPLDIILEVIEHLYLTYDVATIQVLSTTCRALIEPSQRKLFRKTTIRLISHSSKCSRRKYLALCDLLDLSPHISTYIRHLTVEFTIPHPDYPIIIAMTQKLVSLEGLCLITTNMWVLYTERDFTQWNEFITKILHRPSLKQLRLIGNGLLPPTILRLPDLRSVDLGRWNIYAAESLPDTCKLPLRRLAIDWNQITPEVTLRRFLKVSPNLETLEVGCDGKSSPQRV